MMKTGTERTFELLEKLSDSKSDLVDALVFKGEDASNSEPLDDLHEKALKSGVNASDATATAEDLREGKTAYAGTSKIIGTIPTYKGSCSEGANIAQVSRIGTPDKLTALINTNFKNIEVENIVIKSIKLERKEE